MSAARRRERHVRLRRETVELLQGEPELLAIADAIQATQSGAYAGRTRRSLAARVTVIAAVFGAVALAVGIGLELSGSGNDLIDRAEAAAGGGRVTTVIASRAVAGESVVDLASGVERPVIVHVEAWRDTVTGRTRFRVLHDDHLLYDALTRRLPSQLLSIDDTVAVVSSFAARYRLSLRDRTAVRTTGSTSVAGRPVVWLRLGSNERSGENGDLDVALDVQTLRPVRLRSVRSQTGWTVSSFVTSDSLRAFRASMPTQLPGDPASTLVSATHGTMASARAWLGSAFLAPGAGAAGGRLRRVDLQAVRLGRAGAERIVRGVSLSFGPVASSLDINLAAEPTQTHGFADNHLTISFSAIPPDGQVALTRLSDRWVAQGRRDGAYFSIEGPSRSSVLGAARSLR